MKNFNEILNGQKPVLVDFFAEWCGPCKAMAPILSEVKSAAGDKVSILKVDVDKNPALAANLGVRGVPTLVLFRNGSVRWRQAGIVSAAELLKVINANAG